MPGDDLFLDTSALIAGIISAQGGGRALLLLAEDGKINVTISTQVLAEMERNLARKSPRSLPFARELILRARLNIVSDPPMEAVRRAQAWISHPADAPILAAAVLAGAGFLATLNTRHFTDDPAVAAHSGLRIGTPGDALAWVRRRLQGG